MELQLHNSTEKLTLADAVFAVPFNEALVHQVVTAYLSGARSGTKAQKSRSDVRGGGRKPWRQKGTGRARAGTIRSPIWRGGGVTFAARPRDFTQKVNRKMYRGALRSILAELARRDCLVLVDTFTIDQPKTKDLIAGLKSYDAKSALIVTSEVDANLGLSSRNLHNIDVCDVESVNPIALLAFEKVLMTRDAVKKVEAWLS